MSLLRSVAVPGVRLFLSAMPGRVAPLAEHAAEMADAGITHILCLTSAEEIAAKSPDYAAAGAMGLERRSFPIADFGTPEDLPAFTAWVQAQSELLRAGAPTLLHCAAGIGRTGMVGICLLRALGHEDAEALIEAAGSHPETPEQRRIAAAGARP